MRTLLLAILIALTAGCNTTDKLVYLESAKEGDQGVQGEIDTGSFLGGARMDLKNIGKYVGIPRDWKGPIPPDWQRGEADTDAPSANND